MVCWVFNATVCQVTIPNGFRRPHADMFGLRTRRREGPELLASSRRGSFTMK
jgi:hypothetical protein